MTKPINPTKREWLVLARKNKGLTTRDCAEIFGVSFQHYNDIENGRRNPSVELMLELSNFFEIPVEKFLMSRTKFGRSK